MMKNRVGFLLVMAVAVIFSGCAATDMQMRGNFNRTYLDIPEKNLKDYKDRDIQGVFNDRLLQPADTTGITETPALLRGEFTCYDVPFPAELQDEQVVPERIRWYALVVSQGHEYIGQFVKRSFSNTAELLIDGDAKVIKNAKALVLSTRATRVFKLSVDEADIAVDRNKLMSDASYRQELVEKNGTNIADFPKSDQLIKDIAKWNRFNSPRGYILTPLAESEFRQILAINPGYTFSQRLVGRKWVRLFFSTDPFATTIGAGMNVINAAAGRSNGWDFDSLGHVPAKKPETQTQEEKKDAKN